MLLLLVVVGRVQSWLCRQLGHDNVEEAAIEDLDVQRRIVALSEGYIVLITQWMQFIHQLDGGRIYCVAKRAVRVLNESQCQVETTCNGKAHAMQVDFLSTGVQ